MTNQPVLVFESMIEKHLNDGVRMPVPDYALTCVTNKYGYAYFTHQGKVKAMNYSTAIFLINDNVRALYVRYEVGDRTQRYMVKTFDQGIVVDDYLVVPQTGKYNMAIAKVTDVDVDVDFDSMTFVPWVLQKLDFSPFNEIIRQEDVA